MPYAAVGTAAAYLLHNWVERRFKIDDVVGALTAEDIREGLVAVLSVFVQEPQFQGQTKDRLNNPELTSAVDSAIRPALEHWLNTNISVAESIVARILLAARAREASRAAHQGVGDRAAVFDAGTAG